jgi:hypothetical protein
MLMKKVLTRKALGGLKNLSNLLQRRSKDQKTAQEKVIWAKEGIFERGNGVHGVHGGGDHEDEDDGEEEALVLTCGTDL